MRHAVTGPTLCLLLLMAIIPAGCGHPTVEAKTKAADTTSIDRRALDPPLPKAPDHAQVPGPDFPLDADVRVQSAVFNTKNLRDAEEKLSAHYRKELKPVISRSQGMHNLDSPQAALPAIQKAACTLREMAEEVIKSHAAFEVIAEKYEKDLNRSPASYQLAAAYYREKSAEATVRVFKEGYQTHATNCDILAAFVQERARAFAKFRADVADVSALTKLTAIYLRDIEHYCSLASPIDSAELTRSYREHLKVYIRSFAGFVSLYEEWSGTLKKRPLPERPSDPAPSPVPPSSEERYPPRRFVSHVRVASESEDSVCLSTANAGRSYERFWRDLHTDRAKLIERVNGRPPASLSPEVRAELERFTERVNSLRSVEQLSIHGTDAQGFVTPTERIQAGTLYPLFRGEDMKLVAVVRVGIAHGGKYPVSSICGEVAKCGDKVIRIPPGHMSLQTPSGRVASW